MSGLIWCNCPQQLNNLARGVVGGATLQQLLLQSHQRTLSGTCYTGCPYQSEIVKKKEINGL